MKSSTQTAGETKTKAPVAKTIAAKRSKSRSKTKRAQRLSVSEPSAATTYTASAQRFLRRGKDSAANAMTWIGQTGATLPRAAQTIGSDVKSVQSYLGERPMMLGAMGVAVGVLLGSMMPTLRHSPAPAAKSRRRK
jgi:hypothetical protein